ncbi:CPBP family intramembrane metalloprotease [Microlunatus panaciterrae]
MLIAYAAAWLVILPLWLNRAGLKAAYAPVLLVAMMAAPTVAALITCRVFPSGGKIVDETGLRPQRTFRSWWRLLLIAWLGPVVLAVLSTVLAGLVGVYHADLKNFSGFAEQLARLSPKPLPIPISLVVLLSAVQVLPGALINTVPALGEELGWRGLLQPMLGERLGQWPAAVVTGVIWGLWHAPVILLGYNYPSLPPVLALLFMIVFCTLLSVLLGWLRLAGGTVWVAALAHGSVNASAGLPLLFVASGSPVDNVTTGLLGWTGWVLLVLAVISLVLLRRFPVRRPERIEPSGAAGTAAGGPR